MQEGILPLLVAQKMEIPTTPLFVKTHDFLLWLIRHTQRFPKNLRHSYTLKVENAGFEFQEAILMANAVRGTGWHGLARVLSFVPCFAEDAKSSERSSLSLASLYSTVEAKHARRGFVDQTSKARTERHGQARATQPTPVQERGWLCWRPLLSRSRHVRVPEKTATRRRGQSRGDTRGLVAPANVPVRHFPL